jgi:hypothetical protein
MCQASLCLRLLLVAVLVHRCLQVSAGQGVGWFPHSLLLYSLLTLWQATMCEVAPGWLLLLHALVIDRKISIFDQVVSFSELWVWSACVSMFVV